MGIQRYSASLDTTISNAYEMNLTLRATGSNMGLADTLEVFSIYGQAASASSELSRILIQFPTTDISADRTAGTIPASGSDNLKFFLRMYNAEHAYTVPKDYNLIISAITRSWEEGYGLDMDEYTDLTYDDVGSNWARAASGSVASTATITFSNRPNSGEQITLIDASGTSKTLTALNTVGEGLASGLNFSMLGSAESTRNALDTCITDNTTITTSRSSTDALILTQNAGGVSGDTTITSNLANATITGLTVVAAADGKFTGGGNDWTTAGGDYYSDASSSFTASFLDGTEHLEVDVTPLVEQWISSSANLKTAVNMGLRANYGVLIKFPDASEAAARSYYTKKFFARGSQYFLKRPTIEARWDSSTKDNQGSFYLSSSLASAADNLNKIYIYNSIRGQLTNLPNVGTGPILVSIYSGSANNTAPSGSKLLLPLGDGVKTVGDTNITGGHVSTGIYSASFAYASSSITTIFPVWHSGSVEYNTGSAISVKTFNSSDHNPHSSYASKITNLRDTYTREEKMTRFRLYVREKDWNPNIYTKASSDISTSIIEDAYYRVYRTADEFEVVAYGTGSTNHTRLSYDASGSYFDFPMDILEAGYMYAFKFLYKMPDGNYREQPETFKFRVD